MSRSNPSLNLLKFTLTNFFTYLCNFPRNNNYALKKIENFFIIPVSRNKIFKSFTPRTTISEFYTSIFHSLANFYNFSCNHNRIVAFRRNQKSSPLLNSIIFPNYISRSNPSLKINKSLKIRTFTIPFTYLYNFPRIFLVPISLFSDAYFEISSSLII